MWRRMTTPTRRVEKKERESKKLQRRETNEKRQSVEKSEDQIFLSNKVRIKGPATVAPPPFPIPAFILVFVLRNEEKSSTL